VSDQLLLGIDLGTSGAKALLVDPAGSVEATATAENPMRTPYQLRAEQDPKDWWCAAVHPAPADGFRRVGAVPGRTVVD
jgi:xylulokinase